MYHWRKGSRATNKGPEMHEQQRIWVPGSKWLHSAPRMADLREGLAFVGIKNILLRAQRIVGNSLVVSDGEQRYKLGQADKREKLSSPPDVETDQTSSDGDQKLQPQR